MTRTLVAGVGNVFFGDDGFGVEVAQLLARAEAEARARSGATLAGARVTDFGIRAIHLAYELLDCELCVIADCMPRGGAPGTLYVVEPVLDEADAAVGDAHGMNLPVVFAAARQLGPLPRILVVGCEPASTEPGIGLSAAVARSIPGALALIRDLVREGARADRTDAPSIDSPSEDPHERRHA